MRAIAMKGNFLLSALFAVGSLNNVWAISEITLNAGTETTLQPRETTLVRCINSDMQRNKCKLLVAQFYRESKRVHIMDLETNIELYAGDRIKEDDVDGNIEAWKKGQEVLRKYQEAGICQ